MKKYKSILNPIAIIVLFATQSDAVAVTADYSYDALGRLTNVVYTNGKQLNYSYDAAGNILQLTAIGNTNCGDTNVFITQKTYGSFANEICRASTQLAAGTDVLISTGATVAYYAPQVVLRSGFRAALGSYFIASTQENTNNILYENLDSNDSKSNAVNNMGS